MRNLPLRALLALSFLWESILFAEEARQPARPTAQTSAAAESKQPTYKTESLRGKVVWMSDALKRRYGIQVDPQSAESLVMLQTPAGELHAIVPDVRGRAFMVDPRLRDIDVELLVRRYEGSPMVQVIRLYHVKEDGKYEVDYWCDVCAISMYILKKCECCQGPTRLRERLVDKDQAR